MFTNIVHKLQWRAFLHAGASTHFLALQLAYFLIVLGVGACGLVCRREVQRKPMRRWHLYAPPVIATFVALVPLLQGSLVGQRAAVWVLALGAGFAIGLLRGAMVRIQVDQMWALVRVPQAPCALIAVILIALLGAGRIAADIVGPAGVAFLEPLAAALAWCAGFLAGRAAAIAARVRRAPHYELRQF